jgi:hypothetical protein
LTPLLEAVARLEEKYRQCYRPSGTARSRC